MLRSFEIRLRGHSSAEQLALPRRLQFCFLPMCVCPCQVGFRIPQRELERNGIERGESRALLDLITHVHVASDHPAEHSKAQDGFVTGFHRSGEGRSSCRFRRGDDAEHRPNWRRRCVRHACGMPSVRRPRLIRESRMFSWLVLLRDGDLLVRTHLLRVARDDKVARPQPRRDNDSVCFVSRDRDRPC